VILRRNHGAHGPAIAEREDRHLLASQTLLDDDTVPGCAKDAFVHDGVDRLARLLFGGTDVDTLASRQPVRLDDYRRRVAPEVVQGC